MAAVILTVTSIDALGTLSTHPMQGTRIPLVCDGQDCDGCEDCTIVVLQDDYQDAGWGLSVRRSPLAWAKGKGLDGWGLSLKR